MGLVGNALTSIFTLITRITDETMPIYTMSLNIKTPFE